MEGHGYWVGWRWHPGELFWRKSLGLGMTEDTRMTPDPQSKMMIQMLNSWWALACTSQKRCCLESRLAGSRGPH